MYDITVSMGVACFPQDGLDYLTLFHHADQALYAAKRRGRRQYCLYELPRARIAPVLALCAQYAWRPDCFADRATAGGLAGSG